MTESNAPEHSDPVQNTTEYLRQERNRAAAAHAATSPSAIEATLASISAEVMDEAIARRARADAATSLKT